MLSVLTIKEQVSYKIQAAMHRRMRQRGGYGSALMFKPKLKKRRRKQKGGVVPLAAAIPVLIAVGKVVGLGAAGRAASYAGKEAMKTLFKKKQKRRHKFNMVRHKRIVKEKKRQRGGAMLRRKPRLVDKITEGMSMIFSGPSPTFATLGAKLAGQALKGVTNNIQRYKPRCKQ